MVVSITYEKGEPHKGSPLVRVPIKDLNPSALAKTKSKPSDAGSIWKGGATQ